LLQAYAKPRMMVVDSKGIISRDRKDLNPTKRRLLEFSNLANISGSFEDVLAGADVYIGVIGLTQPGLLNKRLIQTMDKNPIIISMTNPVPEIMPDDAKAAGVAVMATGRSDFPNQVNNSLAFPGIFRGALDNQVRQITDKHKIAAAEALANLIQNPTPDKIIPGPFDADILEAVSSVIR
jgi:malate dehydrogenase (oxaloacetate-decarboxylating)